MTKFMRNCLAVGFTVAFLAINPSPVFAATAVEHELAVIAGKIGKLEGLIAAGSCASCAGSIAVLKADLEKLKALPDLRKEDRAELDKLDRKADALDQKLAGIAGQLSELGSQIGALDRKVDAQTALAGENATKVALLGVRGVFDIPAANDDVDDEAAKAAVALTCPPGYFVEVDRDKDYRQSRRGLRSHNHSTFTCKKAEEPKKAEVPAAALAPPPSAPVVTSSRTTLGWVASGVVGAAAFGVVGAFHGNSLVPMQVTDNGWKWGMGPSEAAIGGLVGALVGAGVYALATQ